MRIPFVWLIFTCAPLLADNDDSFRERFADPATRSAALSELVPGTRAAFFHTALDHQLAAREAEFRKTLTAWKAAAERKENPISSSGLIVLENRQLLIEYQKSPAASLAELIRRLGLEFDDTRPDAAAAAESLPTRLDPDLITEAAFEKAATQEGAPQPYTKYRDPRILRELSQVKDFDETKIRWFINTLNRADVPGVVTLIDRSLKFEKPVTFGSEPLHQKLTSDQLSSLLATHPELRTNNAFNLAYLTKLRPGAETDFSRDLPAHAAHLARCRDFALTLPPAQNSLKAHILFHHLRLQQEIGKFPKADLLAFLALPRQRHQLLRIPENSAPDTINLDSDFAAATDCQPVKADLPLIESYLHHFLSQTDSAKEFAPFIEQKRLALLHARARLLAGENPDRWGQVIDPSEFKSLQTEARIAFAPGAPTLLDSNAAVSLTLDLKNTPDLLIRIYELDLPAHLARNSGEPDVGIDLDGLVPHHERRITFAQTPIVLHREAIALPELSGPGAWLVDFVSGQVSARSLIRKGRLVTFPERTATGQTVRVFDENAQPVPTATISLGRETFTADDSGRITIPNAPNQPATSGILTAGKLAAPISLDSRSDNLALEARFHLAREQLLADQEARLHFRVRLTNHGHEIPLDRIKEPALILKAELLGGVTTERVIAENLTLTPVLEIPFQVPADLLKLTLTLRGTVTLTTGGDPLKLEDQAIYEINTDLKKSRIGTAFFSPTTTGHRLEVRGRNGEPLPSRAITLSCASNDYDPDIKLEVRTDAHGRVDLGKLDGIDYLTASGTDIAEVSYSPNSRDLDWTSTLQLPPLSEIRLPLEKPAAIPNRLELSLVETLDKMPVRDHYDKLTIEDGQLVIRKLPPGDFTLTQGGQTTSIQISSGIETGGLLVSKTRILPLHSPRNPTIASAITANDELKIQLRDFGPDTRVSIIGNRYNHDWSGGSGLNPFAPPVSNTIWPDFHSCNFLIGRHLSDEMRYILDRRFVQTFPGSMLPRPGLLLNRWTDEDMVQSDLTGSGGTDGSGHGGMIPCAMMKRGPSRDHDQHSASDLSTVCDFLEMPAVVKFNLTPKADSTLTLPLGDFTGSQFLQITVIDAFANDSLILPLPASETPVRDRRIARPLDPKAHHLATRSAAVLVKGASATIENLLDADWRAFTTLTEAHQFLYGMSADERLREFIFLTEWPTFDEPKKLDLLSKHACHELHLFLAHKDKPFFVKHVQPLLTQKPEPQFMDDYLLGRELSSYLRPYAWQRLNAAEKALLAQALPEAQQKRIVRELSLRWELEAPAPDAETLLFTQTLRGSDLALIDSLGLARRDLEMPKSLAASDSSDGLSYITEKLRRIIIPRIDFENTTVEEAIDFLRMRSMELDTLELDPSRKGMNFVIRRPRPTSNNNSLDANDPGSLRIKELKLQNVPLSVALKYVCDAAKLRYKTDDFAVTLVPQTEAGEDVTTRVFNVPPDFASSLDSGDSSGLDADPFAASEPTNGSSLKARLPISELLKKAGIALPEGASANLSGGKLIVTNTPMELDKIEALTMALSNSPGPSRRQASADGFAGAAMEGDPFDSGVLPPLPSDPFAAAPSGGERILLKARAPQLFPDKTKLWREANYYHNTAATDESLIPLNRFWLDLAAWNGEGAFLSPHFNACHTSPNAALMCLALLDLPFKAERPEVTVDGNTLRVKAREPMVLFYKDTRRTEQVAPESPLLLRQSFSPLAEAFRIQNGRQVENPVTGNFRPGQPYTAQLIVTNPTGIGRRIDLLAQIPAGAIPLQGKPATLSSTAEIEPHGVLKQELAFYFPTAGDFAVYPLHISEDGIVLAHTAPRTLRVSNDPEKQDAAAWQVLARDGSNDEVLNRLLTENLDTIDLSAIRWRLQDKAFFLKVSETLRDRLHFSKDVASYAFHHNDVAGIRTYFENSEAVRQLGQWLDSPLLEVRPRVHHDWETLEFDPLINPRAHRFGENPRMSHEQARDHYQAFLDQLAWKPTLDASDQLALTAYLFLQDRIAEALDRFPKIDPEKLPSRVNYDYLHAVVLFYQEKPGEAKAIAAATLPKLPPGLWRDRFQAVIDQSDEIAALAGPEISEKPAEESAAPQLEISLADGGKLVIRHRKLEKATLRLFSVDLEMLFSKNPFLQGGTDNGEPAIRPNEILEVPLAANVSETTVGLPAALQKGNVLVSAESGSTNLLRVLDSRAIDLRHLPLERTVRVLDAASSKPLVKTYVKVYAEMRNGEIVFHKDGYTDLRGKFDYLSHTGTDASNIKRVAILASHPEKGATTAIY